MNLYSRGFTNYMVTKALNHLSPGVDPLEILEARRLPSPEAANITKAAIGASGLADLSTGSYAMGSTAFWKETEHFSCLQRLIPAFQRVIPNVPVQVQTAILEGSEVGEEALIPLDQVNLSALGVTLRKACALFFGSNDFFRARGCAPALERIAQKTGAAASDKVFLEGVVDDHGGSSAITATADPRADLAGLLEVVNTSGSGNLFFVVHPLDCNHLLAAGSDTNAPDPFFDLSPTGGSIFGVPVLVSQFLPRDSTGGSALLVDASRIMFSDFATTVHASEGAAIQSMSDDPTGDGNSWISLFQADCTAIKIVRHFGWLAESSAAVAVLNGIDWSSCS